MRVVAISQARMTSTRLPGKVLIPVAGRSLLAWHLDRLRLARRLDAVMVATTVNASDDPIVALCQELGVQVFRGSEHDVLARYHGAAAAAQAGVVVRVTSDCPLIDPGLVDRVLERLAAGQADYVSNIRLRTFPRGLDAEAFGRDLLDLAASEATDPAEREHVTPFIWRRPERFRLAGVVDDTDPTGAQGRAHYRWTVDTPEDLALIERMLGALAPLGPGFSWRQALTVYRDHPEWAALNAAIAQKPV